MTISVEHRGRVYTWEKAGIYSTTGMGFWRTDKGNIVRSRALKAKLERLASERCDMMREHYITLYRKGGAA